MTVETPIIDPNPKLAPRAPMDDLRPPPPTIPHIPHSLAQSRRLPSDALNSLKDALKRQRDDEEEEDDAEVWEFGEDNFRIYASVFNGVIKSVGRVLVRPRCARQISRLIIFCRANNLDLSVKAGGYGTQGWSVSGSVILDLSLMKSVSVNLPPMLDPNHKTLRDLNWPRRRAGAAVGAESQQTRKCNKGKGKAYEYDGGVYAGSGKRSMDEAFYGDMGAVDVQPGTNAHWNGNGNGNGMNGMNGNSHNGYARMESSPPPLPIAAGKANIVNGRLDESSKRSLMEALAGPTEWIPQAPGTMSGDGQMGQVVANGYPISTIPGPALNFAGTEVPFGMGERRWQFGRSVSGDGDGYDAYGNAWGDRGQSSSSSSASSPNQPPYTLVTFDAGATAKEIDKITHDSPFGPYHVPFAAFPVGSAVMLSGGFGFLSRLHGLSMDNLTEVEMVLADGRIVWIGRESMEDSERGEMGRCFGVEMRDGKQGMLSETEAKDLWWALRGAGTILGVATRYRAKAYHVPVVYSGNLIYPFNPRTAPNLIKHVRDCVKGSPRSLYANIILTAGPTTLAGVIIVQLCVTGSQQQGSEYLTAIASWDEERCLLKDVRERIFLEQQDSVANVLKGGAGRKWFIKSDLMNSLTDEIVHKTTEQFNTVPDGCTWLFELTGGALVDTKTTCLPMSHRTAQYTVAALHQWPVDVPAEDVKCVTTAINWIDNIVHPVSPGGPLPCFQESSHPDAVKGTFGENYDKIAAIKKHFDPQNVFRHSIWPSDMKEGTVKQVNPLMKFAPTREQIAKEEDSVVGMAGIEAVTDVVGQAKNRSSNGSLATPSGPTQRQIVDEKTRMSTFGMEDGLDAARYPEEQLIADGTQTA